MHPPEINDTEECNEESWHDASEEGWEITCGKAKDDTATEQEKEEEDRVRNRHDQGTIRSVFCFGWDAIQAWIIQPNLNHGANQANAEPEAELRRTSPDENRGRQVPHDQAGRKMGRPDRYSEGDSHEEKT